MVLKLKSLGALASVVVIGDRLLGPEDTAECHAAMVATQQ
jgi:hypothetical protein